MLNISLSVFGESDIRSYTIFDAKTEKMLLKSKKGTVLLVDSGIPGVDYWSLVGWLGRHFSGKTIIFTEARSYNIQHAQLIPHGCHAVISKTQGFSACWAAILSFRKGEKYYSSETYRPFDDLKSADLNFVKDLLLHDIKALTELYGISQQGINKKKLSVYKKLNIVTENPDVAFRLLASLYHV